MPEKEHEFEIRPMTDRDLADVDRVEEICSTGVHPNELGSGRKLFTVLRSGLVALVDGQIVGFVICRMQPRCVEVLLLVDDPAFAWADMCSHMMRYIVSRLPILKRTQVEFPVAETNLNGQLFLRSLGFRAVAIERDPGGQGEDQYRFVYAKPVMEVAGA